MECVLLNINVASWGESWRKREREKEKKRERERNKDN